MTTDIKPKLAGSVPVVWQLVQVIIFACVIPWSVWVTSSLQSISRWQARTEMWMEQGPRFTSKDADTLELRVMDRVMVRNAETTKLLSDKLDRLATEIADLRVAVTETKLKQEMRP